VSEKTLLDRLFPESDPEFFTDDDLIGDQWTHMTLEQRTCVFCGRDDIGVGLLAVAACGDQCPGLREPSVARLNAYGSIGGMEVQQ
jgi:hypothetical protein